MLDFTKIREATVAARDGKGAATPEQHKNQDIADHINAEFGCHKDQTRKLVEMLGFELPEPSKSPSGVPKVNTLAIDNEERVCACSGVDSDGDCCVIRIGEDGVDTGYICRTSDWRYATDEEIDRFERDWNAQ